MIHEDTGELIAYGALEQSGSHGAVHTAGEGQQHAAIADLAAARGHGLLQIRGHGPLGAEAADVVEEVLQDLLAVLRMEHLGMELNAVKLLVCTAHGGMAAAGGMGDGPESGSQLLHLHAMAHPADGGLRHLREQGGGAVMGQLDLAVLAGLRRAALAAQQVHHQLLAIANAQHGDAHLEQGLVHHGSVGGKHGGGAAGEDQGIRPEGTDLVRRDAVGLDLTVDAALTDAAGDQQVILTAKIQNKDFFHVRHPPGNGCGAHRPRR